MSEINVVPYIDVMLVLLVIFMITAPLLTQGVRIDLPRGTAEPIDTRNETPIVVDVDRNGLVYLRGDEPPVALDEETLVARVNAQLRLRPGVQVLVSADRAGAYGNVVSVMAMLQQAGAPSVGLMTEPPPPAGR